MQLFAGSMKDRVLADMQYLDKERLLTAPAFEIIAGRDQGVSQRDTWALWSLSQWIKHFKPSFV